MNNSTSINVLAIMLALANYAKKIGAPKRHAPMLLEARDAISELLDADMEYDAAFAALDATHAGTLHDEFVALIERRDSAVTRRSAAIARCKGKSRAS